MDLRKDYEKLYQHWLNEFQQAELTSLSQDIFDDYKRIVNTINDYEAEREDNLKNQLLESYKNNLNYLLKDLLKIREMKIINFALTLKEIDLENVIEAEKLYYQNLVSSIKGYKKLKRYSLYGDIEDIIPEKKVVIEEDKEIQSDKLKVLSEDTIKESKEDFNYTLIRFLKKTPPLVGIDLINYGPFEKEDIANLPFKNAKILNYENFAEKIELS